MEIIESDIEIEILNSKLRLLSWLYEELKYFSAEIKQKIKQKGRELPLNL